MTEHKARPKSGDKIINDVGVKAIKNGQKRRTDEKAPRGDKPKWLRFVSPGGEGYQDVKKLFVRIDCQRYAKKPCVPTSANAGVQEPRRSCSWDRFVRERVNFVQLIPETPRDGSISMSQKYCRIRCLDGPQVCGSHKRQS